jgi:hypothetical protein
MLVSSVAYYSILKMEVTIKCPLTFNRLHAVISHNIEVFITTTMSTSDPIYKITHEERSVFGEVIPVVSVTLSKQLYIYMCRIPEVEPFHCTEV